MRKNTAVPIACVTALGLLAGAADASEASSCHNRGVLLAARGAYEEALAPLRRALELEDAADTHEALGLTFLNLGSNQAALAEYELALAGGRKSAATRFNRGLALERLGRRSEAAEAYRDALAADASFAPAQAGLRRIDGGGRASRRP